MLLLGAEERCHNEIGAPDSRIDCPVGLVLTPWDKISNPVFGPVATARTHLAPGERRSQLMANVRSG